MFPYIYCYERLELSWVELSLSLLSTRLRSTSIEMSISQWKTLILHVRHLRLQMSYSGSGFHSESLVTFTTVWSKHSKTVCDFKRELLYIHLGWFKELRQQIRIVHSWYFPLSSTGKSQTVDLFMLKKSWPSNVGTKRWNYSAGFASHVSLCFSYILLWQTFCLNIYH